MVRIRTDFYNSENNYKKKLKKWISEEGVGGVILFHGNGNIHGIYHNIQEFQSWAKTPLIVGSDLERGLAQQVGSGATSFPHPMAVAATGDTLLSYKQGYITAQEGLAVGIHAIFSPIMDVNNNPNNPIINIRAYSDNPQVVSDYGVAFIRGVQDRGAIACPKHFPGHGNTSTDSHTSLPVIPGTKEELENYEVAHFRLLSDSNYLPYGKSQVEGGRKIWKQLSLMEDAMLIHRIMRAPEKRVFKVDIGNLPPSEVDNYMKRIIDKMKKAPVVDEQTGEYNLKYNMQNLTEDFYLPVRGGDSGTGIESLPGLTYEAVEDIEYLRNKLLASLKIPKAFLGYEEQVGSKATLAAEDVRFARTIERIQRIVVSELTKIAVAHLYSQGYTDAALVDFDLELTNPSTIYEQERLDLWEKKNTIARDMKAEALVSKQWIYDNVFNFTDEDVETIAKEVIDDKKDAFRLSSIENEGHDPAQPAQEGQMKPDQPTLSNEEDDEEDKDEKSDRDTEDRDNAAGVRDPLGKFDYTHAKDADRSTKHNYRKSPLALSHYNALKKHHDVKEREMLTEIEETERELNGSKEKL